MEPVDPRRLDELAFRVMEQVSSCKYLSDSLLQGAIRGVLHRRNEPATPELLAALNARLVPALAAAGFRRKEE